MAWLAGAGPASAAPGAGSAFGVKVNVTLTGQPAVDGGPLAAANTAGPTTDTLASVTVPGVVTTGVINTSAQKDANTGAVTSTASTADVGLPVLSGLGTVSATVIKATCTATQSGETGSTTLTNAKLGSLGALAVDPAVNTTIAISLPAVGHVATLILNEQVPNADGSLTVNAVHLHLLGGVGSPGSGDVIISSATCGPAGLPMPIASGLGLWIGLGLLGAIAVPVAWSAVRRRRTSVAV